MRIRFKHDMPVSVVEVLAPDNQSVKRIAMMPGSEEVIPVPSERSLVRLYLPSGRIVTLARREDLNYIVGLAELEPPGTTAREDQAVGSQERERVMSREKNGSRFALVDFLNVLKT